MKIAIAGFGVAGGALALFLVRAGHSVTLFERAPEPGPVGGGLLLQPSGQAVLRSLGLLEQIESRSARLLGIEAWTPRGRRFSKLQVGRSLPGQYALGVHRGVLFTALYDVARVASVEICPGSEIVSAVESPNGVEAVDVQGVGRGIYDLLACCDGARSRLRQMVNPGHVARASNWGALWGTGPCDAVSDHLHQVADGTRRLAGIVPVGQGRATLFWGLHRSELESFKARGFERFVAEAQELFPAAAEILRGLGSFSAMTWANWQRIMPRRMYRGRIVLAGDAAHAMSPQLGQGANLALLDAAALAAHLDNLQEWERQRRRNARFLGLLSSLLDPFFQSRMPLLGTLRNLGLPLLEAVPWVRRQMELTLAGAKTGFLDRLWS